jgi:hypothetical protein
VLRVNAKRLDGPYGVLKLRVRVENTTPWPTDAPTREEALRHALVATHILLATRDGAFISLIDPPEWARPAVQACVNERTWPVLVGEPGQRDLMLSAPIISASTELVPRLRSGDFALVDRGMILRIIEPEEAEAILAIYAEMEQLLEPQIDA